MKYSGTKSPAPEQAASLGTRRGGSKSKSIARLVDGSIDSSVGGSAGGSVWGSVGGPSIGRGALLERPPEGTTGRSFTILTLICLSLAGLSYCSLAAFWPKFSRAEVFFAECAREMIATSNFVTPLYHNQPFFDKPILVYWLIIAMFQNFGLSHFAARLPSIIAALGTVLTTVFAGAALFERRSGLIAGAMLATSFMFLSFASLCMSDMLLVLFDSLTLSFFYLGVSSDKRRTLYWLAAALTMGLAFLTKGPIGVVLPSATAFIYLLIIKQLRTIKLLHIVLGALIVLLVASPWFMAAYQVNGMSAVIYFFVHENLQRFAGSAYDAGRPFWYVIVSLFLGFAPWSLFLPLALIQFISALRNASKSKQPAYEVKNGSLYLWLWVGISVGFFCFSRGKCDYYTLPAYPAAAILTAHFLSQQWAKPAPFTWVALYAFASVFLLGGLASCAFLPNLASQGIVTTWWLLPIELIIIGGLMFAFALRKRLGPCFITAAIGICATTILFSSQIMPSISAFEPIGKYAGLIDGYSVATEIGVDQALHSWIDEISFQTGRHPITLTGPSELRKFLQSSKPAIVLVSESKLQELPDRLVHKLKILTRDKVITHSLTPGYFIERRGDLTDPAPVVLVSNAANQRRVDADYSETGAPVARRYGKQGIGNNDGEGVQRSHRDNKQGIGYDGAGMLRRDMFRGGREQ